MLAETIPESEFGYPNSVLAKTAPFFFAGFKVFHCPGISTALLPVGALHAALIPGRGIFILSADSLFKVQLFLLQIAELCLST